MFKTSSQFLSMAGAAALASAGLVSVAGAQTVSVTTAVGNGASTYIANDVNAEASSPNGSAGYTITRYENTSGGYEDISLFRFDLTGLVPSGMYITNPTLNLTVNKNDRDRILQVFGLSNYTTANYNWNPATTIYPGDPAISNPTSYTSAPGFVAAASASYGPALLNPTADVLPSGTDFGVQFTPVSGTGWTLIGQMQTGTASGGKTASGQTISTSLTVPGVSNLDNSNTYLSGPGANNFANFLQGALTSGDSNLVTIAVINPFSDRYAYTWFDTANDGLASSTFPTLTFDLSSSPPPPVPEPTPLLLLAPGVAALMLLRTRAAKSRLR